MKSTDADILIVPGLGGSGADHWQTRWEGRLSAARRVVQADWDRPEREAWTETLAAAVNEGTKPVVVVAHSLGVPTLAHAVPLFAPGRVAAAFLVAPPDLEREDRNPLLASFSPVPERALPFPAVVIASRTDPYCPYERAARFARAWGAELVDAGDAGHINAASGHGPWPEGSMRLLGLLQALG